MTAYLVRRLGQAALLLVVVSMIGFAILHLAPGGPMAQYALGSNMSQEDLDRIAQQLGLDRPLLVQYAEWFWRMLAETGGLRTATDGRCCM
jgi:peptide/nickel transport system permease protein